MSPPTEAEEAHRQNRARAVVECMVCGTKKSLYPSVARKRVGFCSRSCSMRARGARQRREIAAKPPEVRAAEVAARFWEKVHKGDGCWEWTGARCPAGYGNSTFGGRYQKAHRIAWMLERGVISDGLFVCHHCDNPVCVRPDHLFLGTPRDNILDSVAKGRFRKARRLAGGAA